MRYCKFPIATSAAIVLTMISLSVVAKDALPSWNNGPAKEEIIGFVNKVSNPKSKDFVPQAERIATFDNDGTLWAEQPMYTQIFFAIDRVKELAPQHPEWKDKEPFKSILEGNIKQAFAGGEKSLVELVMATHAGMSNEEFTAIVEKWLATAKHPVTGRAYTKMVYQPMLELIDYLKKNDFKVYIVSGGGVEFMRPWTEAVYGIPPEQVIGSSIKTSYQVIDGQPELIREASIDFMDDKAGKPVGINQYIGRRPIAAFGNSDGDLQMLQWTTAGKGKRLGLLVHHTDDKREWAYDRKSAFGTLDKALDLAKSQGWLVVDMANDWRIVYPAE
jgi:hypothetical protein